MPNDNNPNIRLHKSTFVGGEVSRELIGRHDLVPVQNGLDTCRNFIVQPHGVVSNRPGTQFVAEVKNSANYTRLISFSFSDSQAFIIELGAGYFRAHANGARLSPGTPAAYSGATAYVIGDLVSNSGVNYYCIAPVTGSAPPNATYWYAMPAGIYEIPNDYSQAHLSGINYVQSGDVLTLVHPNYPPRELRRYANTRWVLAVINFVPITGVPTDVAATNTFTFTGTGYYKDHDYLVTALNADGLEESLASAVTPGLCLNDLTQLGNYNTITWTAVSGASYYRVYKLAGGTWGYIGQTDLLTFRDDNVLPDLTKTLPLHDTLFASAGNYPATVAYFEQRRFFAGTLNQPQNIWATQSSSDTNMGYSVPSIGSDALRFKIAAQRANGIKYLIPTLDLLAMTTSTEWRIFSDNGALEPSTITIKPQSQNGIGNVAPILVNNYVLYAQSSGGHVREMSYQWGEKTSYSSNDICLLAPHLFDHKTISDMAFTQSPVPIMWTINTVGELCGLTYVPEQKVTAWHKHDTLKGIFESLCSIKENGIDVLYMIVKRTFGSTVKRYVELLHDRNFTLLNDAFFVDCGLTYSGAAATVISGLAHLEGETVSILGDGAVMTQQVVTSGSITLPSPVVKAHIGLPITADMITMPVYIPNDSAIGQGRIKNINQIWVRVHNSGYFDNGTELELCNSGPDSTKLNTLKVKKYG